MGKQTGKSICDGQVESGGSSLNPSLTVLGEQCLTDLDMPFLPLLQSPFLGRGTLALSLGEEGKEGPQPPGRGCGGEAAARADILDDSQAWNALRGGLGQPPVQLGQLERGPRTWGAGRQGETEGQEAELSRGSGLEAGLKGRCLGEGR